MEAFYLMTRLASTPANLALGRADLTHALKIVARGIGRYAGEANLRFENGLLCVEAHGTVASVPASGAWPIPIFVQASWVRRLPYATRGSRRKQT